VRIRRKDIAMRLSGLLGLIYLVSEVILGK
jgi:hypothetical protein